MVNTVYLNNLKVQGVANEEWVSLELFHTLRLFHRIDKKEKREAA